MNPHRFLQVVVLSTLTACFTAFAADDYKLGPDSMPQDGVPRGEVIKMPAWTNSTI